MYHCVQITIVIQVKFICSSDYNFQRANKDKCA